MQQYGTNNSSWLERGSQGCGAPREVFPLVEVLLLCLNADHVVQEKLCSAGCPGPLGAKATSGQGPASPLVGF